MVRFYKEEISNRISAGQKHKLSETPFAHLLEMPEYLVSVSLFQKIFNGINSNSLEFNITGVTVPFTPRDVALILGLMEHGHVIQLYGHRGKRINTGDTTCHLHKTYFAGQYSVKYSGLEEILKKLVGDDEKTDDFVSLLILYIFSMFLFPLPSGHVNLKMLPFAQDLERMSSYSWATAVHQSILFNLAKARFNGSVHIGVCSFAVNIWFMERCNIYDGRVMMGGVPRYYNWSMRQRMKDSAVNEMFLTLSTPLICNQKELPFVHDNEPIIVKTGCKLCLLNKFVVDPENRKRKKPRRIRTVAKKHSAERARTREEEEEEVEEEIEVVKEEEEEEGEMCF